MAKLSAVAAMDEVRSAIANETLRCIVFPPNVNCLYNVATGLHKPMPIALYRYRNNRCVRF